LQHVGTYIKLLSQIVTMQIKAPVILCDQLSYASQKVAAEAFSLSSTTSLACGHSSDFATPQKKKFG